jgi:hypothetical protein
VLVHALLLLAVVTLDVLVYVVIMHAVLVVAMDLLHVILLLCACFLLAVPLSAVAGFDGHCCAKAWCACACCVHTCARACYVLTSCACAGGATAL